MPGLDTRTGRRNVKKGFTTDYVSKVSYQPARERTYGYGTVQAENPVADDGYGNMNFGTNTQSLMNQIAGFQASRPQPQSEPQFEAPSQSSSVSYSPPNQGNSNSDGSQKKPYAMPQPQFTASETTTSYDPSSRANNPAGSVYERDGSLSQQGVVAKPNGGGYTNYGTTNYGTRRVYNSETRQWETKRIVDPQGRLEGE